jgi:hypothetical protein
MKCPQSIGMKEVSFKRFYAASLSVAFLIEELQEAKANIE